MRRRAASLPDYSGVIYTPALPGSQYSHLLFLRDTTFLAQPFDDRKLPVAGDPFPVGEQALRSLNAPMLDAAAGTGTGLWSTSPTSHGRISWPGWIARGRKSRRQGHRTIESGVALSPDGTTVATARTG